MPAISFLPFLQTVPLATRLLTLALVGLSLISFGLCMLAAENTPPAGSIGAGSKAFGGDIPWLVLLPGVSWKYPWVLITSGFVELSVVELIISAISLPLACRYLERIWSYKELIRFCLITLVFSNIIAFGFSWLTYIVVGLEDAWYGTPYHGMSGLQAGFLVAFTQLIPEHQLQLFGKLKVRVKTLPGLYILLSNVLTFVLGPSPYILVQFGFFVSWVYLRFFKISEDGLSRGDRSETFAFQYWFPPPVRPVIAKGSSIVYNLCTRLHIVEQWDDAPGQGGSYDMLPGPGGARAEAERRRALALKALDARLASGSPAPGSASTPAPSASTSAPSGSGSAAVASSDAGKVSGEGKEKDIKE